MRERALRVAVDGSCLNGECLRGTRKSLSELIRRTSASGAVEWHVLASQPQPRMQRRWEQYSLPAAAARLRADVLHAPATTGPWWQPVPTAITIHDTEPWQSEDPAWPAGFYRDRLLPAAYRRAKAIMTDSNSSRRDILARWPALKPRLHVISPGVDDRYLDATLDSGPAVVEGRAVAEPYLLYVGGADPRQRLMWALQAWWSGSAAEATMVVCGLEAAAHEHIRNSVPRHARPRLKLVPVVDEDDMPRLYIRATAVLYPSVDHRFGMPVIEAQAVGTPVLFSDVGSLTELKGPGAVILPVDDLAAWVRMIDLLLQSRSSAAGPNRLARAWASQYSLDAYIDRTLGVYTSIAATSSAVGINSPTPSTDRTVS
jgi:glycosyltransferase involved in cell wall biosynthesis